MFSFKGFIASFSFNSRTREGCDDYHEETDEEREVSIHAPARGAMTYVHIWSTAKCFNSRTREGCDYGRNLYLSVVRFQFTHPRGVRLIFVFSC